MFLFDFVKFDFLTLLFLSWSLILYNWYFFICVTCCLFDLLRNVFLYVYFISF